MLLLLLLVMHGWEAGCGHWHGLLRVVVRHVVWWWWRQAFAGSRRVACAHDRSQGRGEDPTALIARLLSGACLIPVRG